VATRPKLIFEFDGPHTGPDVDKYVEVFWGFVHSMTAFCVSISASSASPVSLWLHHRARAVRVPA
jgi:hypothetical protein